MDQTSREPNTGERRSFKATDFIRNKVTVVVQAHLTPTHVRREAPCGVFIKAEVPGLSIDMPEMTADEAREFARALLASADEADAIDGIVVAKAA